jgi:HSP20 family molecular chaperone IbpA
VTEGLILDKVSYDFIDTKRAVDGGAILQFVVTFRMGVQFVLAFNLESQIRLQDGIRTAYTDGVLELTVKKRPESKPVKVPVN